MLKNIMSILSSFLPSLKILPDSWATSIILKTIQFMIWYETKWLSFYVKLLLKTKNYYETLDNLNHNKWCPEDLAENFINYVRNNHNELVHA
jgi:hypothetical protein